MDKCRLQIHHFHQPQFSRLPWGDDMGIKMREARDSAGHQWFADRYLKGQGQEPLYCIGCNAQIAHQIAHTRERDDKSILIPAYFRLRPGMSHSDKCKFAVGANIKFIASESHDMIEAVRSGRYRLRLVMIRDALTTLGKKPAKTDATTRGGPGKVYERSHSKLPGYINSAKRVLHLRALCDTDDDIASHLELVFEGSTVVPWSQFYYETEHHLDAYYNLLRNTVTHPVALHGTLKSKSAVSGKNGINYVLNFVKSRYRPVAENHRIGVGVEVSIWSAHSDWFANLNDGDELVVFGIWKVKPGEQLTAHTPHSGRFESYVTHKLSLWPALRTQIAKIA